MLNCSMDKGLSTDDAAIKLEILKLAHQTPVKQLDCLTHVSDLILKIDSQKGISPSLSPKRLGLRERITNCCEELFAANLLFSINEQFFSTTPLGAKLIQANPDGISDQVLASLPGYSRRLREISGSLHNTEYERQHYDEGFTAYRDGVNYTDNPYPNDRAEHHAWYNGWAEALDHEDEHGPLFNAK